MSLLLWTIQILLALHTFIGAVWKFSNSEQAVPSLSAIPHGLWMGLIVFEFVCGAALLLPLFKRSLTQLAALAALGVMAEMLLFCAVYLRSGSNTSGQLIYWLVVAGVCAFIAYARFRGIPHALRSDNALRRASG